MERDPVRFVWRAAPGLNAALVAIVAIGLAVLWAALELVRAAIDDAALGLPFAGGRRTAPFLRFAVDVHERLHDGPLVLLPGLSLTRGGLITALLVGFAVAAVAAGILVLASRRLEASVGRRAATALSRRMLDGIASAPLSASGAARQSADMAGRALVGQRRFLGSAVARPAAAGGTIVLALAYTIGVDIALPIATAVGLALYAAARIWRDASDTRLAAADAVSGEALRRALAGLASHLPALAAHGTAVAEQRRIADELAPGEAPGRAAERGSAVGGAASVVAAVAGPLSVLGIGAWAAADGVVSAGEAASSAVAAACAVAALAVLGRWRAELARTRPVFAELARQIGAFNARRRTGSGPELPRAGTLVAEGVSTDPTPREGRLTALDLTLSLPDHVALAGRDGSGVRAFAALLGGQRTARAGRVTFGNVDITAASPADRARRLAYAGGETLLLPGTLRANILYGCPDADAPDIDARLGEAVEAAGLGRLVRARGLAGTVDPRRDPALADGIVAARAAVRSELERTGRLGLVEPFDPDRYNPQATVGENILFGVPLGDTFRDEHLPAHSFMRGLLEREGLDKPLAALGANIAKSTLDIFAGVPEGRQVLDRFAMIPSGERDSYERLLDRRERGQRGAAASRDGERLIALALRYSESRHRLGLIGADLQKRLLGLRRAFAEMLPKSLEPAVEFFRADRLCASAPVLDNLLFGRVAQDRAGAGRDVGAAIGTVLADRGLETAVFGIGLATRIDPASSGLTAAELAAVDIARCLVRGPDNLVVERAFDDLSDADAQDLALRLAAAMAGRGLLVVVPPHADPTLFGRVVRFESGRVLPDDKARRDMSVAAEAVPA